VHHYEAVGAEENADQRVQIFDFFIEFLSFKFHSSAQFIYASLVSFPSRL